jgi:Zn finger protein HypA/HybF involved in hydrogenase expression
MTDKQGDAMVFMKREKRKARHSHRMKSRSFKERKCLKCDQTFNSFEDNRVCDKCHQHHNQNGFGRGMEIVYL